MQVQVQRSDLIKGLTVANGAVGGRSVLPIYTCVLVEAADEGGLRLTGANGEFAISCQVPARVDGLGEIPVPAGTMFDLAKVLDGDLLILEKQEPDQEDALAVPVLAVKSGYGRISHVKGRVDEFPPIPSPSGTPTFAVGAAEMAEAIRQVAFAVGAKGVRDVLTGILMKASGEDLILAAADGYRLTERKLHLETPAKDISAIVPARAMREVARLAEMQEQPVSVYLDRTHAIFEFANVVLVSQLIPGRYPEYQRVIPENWNFRIVTTTADLLRACRMVQAFARDCNYLVHLSVNEGALTVSARSPETGDGVSTIDAQTEGDPIHIAINVLYLTDFLSAISEPQVVIEIAARDLPSVFRPVGRDDLVYVVMPFHVPDSQVQDGRNGKESEKNDEGEEE